MRIHVPLNVTYLSDWNGFELPNGILNKGITACGATTVALENRHKTIICCPRINLIVNKHEQYPETLIVTGDVSNRAILDYLSASQLPKILATFDSIPRLATLIEDKSDWRVVVDEYHYILIDSAFKSQVEIAILDAVVQFPYVTYLSATPIAEKFMKEIDHFKKLDYYELVWSSIDHVKVLCEEIKSPINAALRIVRDYQSGIFPRIELDGRVIESNECVIFLNSVNNIANIIKQTGLSPEEVNIIVGTSDNNDDIIRKIGNGHTRGRIPLKDEPHKMFTFCTSTAFAGCDFYSKCASTFVISDSNRAHTSIDIATELVQIAGRQRLKENPFRSVLTFIYNVNNGAMSREEYMAIIDNRMRVSISDADFKNSILNTDLRNKYIKETEHYIKIMGF